MNNISTGTAAKMFLADERGIIEDDQHRCYCTFNYQAFFNQHKTPFGNLYAFNDETLAPGSSYDIQVKLSSIVLILPVVGSVQFNGPESSCTIHAGQLLVVHAGINEGYKLTNPFSEDLVNFIQISLNETPENLCGIHLYDFDLNANQNKLLQLRTADFDPSAIALQPAVSIGKFKGREEALYAIRNPKSKLIIFVIEGVFEVQGRLLHQRDGLALWNMDEDIEMEALSNDAIVMMIEFN